MLDWHIGMLETEDGTPRNLGPADACTLLRVWLVPAAAGAPRPWICALALASDGLDGVLARRAGPTRIGRDLEGLADAAFAVAALRGAVRHGWLGRGAAAAELARIALGIGYATAVWFGRARAPAAHVLHAARAATPLRASGPRRRRPRPAPPRRPARGRGRADQRARYGCSSAAARLKSAISQPFVREKRRSTFTPSIVPVTRAVSGPP